MGYYIKIGRNDGNIGGLSSKGYHIVRKGLSVFRTYGAVEINGRNKKRINWCKGYQIKEDKTAPKAPDISADKLREEQARSLYELGLSEIKKKKIDKAVEYFQQAIAVKNDIAEFHSQLGLAYKSKNCESMAQAEFKLAVKFNPRDKIASTNAIPDKPKKEEKKGLFGGLFNFGKKK